LFGFSKPISIQYLLKRFAETLMAFAESVNVLCFEKILSKSNLL